MVHDKIQTSGEGATMTPHIKPSASKEEQIAGLVEQISACVEQFHYGSVELIAIENDVIKVRLGGACAECGHSNQTIQGWVAGTIRQFFPDVEVVEVE
jgi:Fe-S cluster biogenesis protein NfuA